MQGTCLCGAVAYEITPPFRLFQYCHCSRCRKVTGSAFGSNVMVAPDQFRWLRGEDRLGRYEQPDAKYFASVFCTRCGSNLPWEVPGGGNVVVPAGTLDEDPGLQPAQNIHWASHAEWFADPGALPRHDVLPPRKSG